MKAPRFFTVILYDRQGYEVERDEAQGMTQAKRFARRMIEDEPNAMKAAVFAEGDKTGAQAVCEWDTFAPSFAAWQKEQDRLEEEREALALERERADEHTESEKAELLNR